MPMYKRSMIVFLLFILLAAGGTYYGYYTSNDTEVLEAKSVQSGDKGTVLEKEGEGEITVYVSGAVNYPGLITIKIGSRVADAINHCGGVLPNADTNGINMAQPLKDGVQIKVPEKGTAVAAAGGSSSGAEQNGRININQADEKTLEGLPGIGPAMAKRIIEYRTENGSFQAVEDLQKVKGIGKAKFEKLKEKATV